MEQLFKHMGHTKEVHKKYYRQTSSSIEMVNIGKLLMIDERNMMAKFRDKDLSEVQLEGKLWNTLTSIHLI